MRHTPGPWKVLPCPVNAGRHPLHDQRWVATADAVVEFGHDPRSWGLESGSLICEMRDGHLGNAPLIAAAPELLEACIHALAKLECAAEKAEPGSQMAHWFAGEDHGLKSTLRTAIANAKGGAL